MRDKVLNYKTKDKFKKPVLTRAGKTKLMEEKVKMDDGKGTGRSDGSNMKIKEIIARRKGRGK